MPQHLHNRRLEKNDYAMQKRRIMEGLGSMLAVKWHDRAVVTFISTYSDARSRSTNKYDSETKNESGFEMFVEQYFFPVLLNVVTDGGMCRGCHQWPMTTIIGWGESTRPINSSVPTVLA